MLYAVSGSLALSPAPGFNEISGASPARTVPGCSEAAATAMWTKFRLIIHCFDILRQPDEQGICSFKKVMVSSVPKTYKIVTFVAELHFCLNLHYP
ncbi:hypothetical protein DNTS_007930 [Danionella cerebrum]|uniref:Uncharacterized protein n=1 Tax=Danionella cerebrum TaxID=2873325 RepID=A0A553PVQ6_9TELE|nr:hypothetical protein DNTS_007930 [Danionella translucida]TRY81774.1 hypothetical protein DNTS_007930 [Danionella translucida]TRY81776.1 hypothetical protein DNTS_007930 [Danionella translucida]TRY81777.1 hypothetical protein DNTS_007930 [Danionella translucida]TRY81778.1 hypothetical protein DNTS_007930 [Danionella translucida]